MSKKQTPTSPIVRPAVPPLTRKEVQEASLQYGRLLDLRDQTIVNPNRDAEIKGIIEHLSTVFVDHAPEFIGCWVAIRDEYEPWLNLQVVQRERLNAIAGQRMAQATKDSAPPAEQPGDSEAPSNVVPLVQE